MVIGGRKFGTVRGIVYVSFPRIWSHQRGLVAHIAVGELCFLVIKTKRSMIVSDDNDMTIDMIVIAEH